MRQTSLAPMKPPADKNAALMALAFEADFSKGDLRLRDVQKQARHWSLK